jgi:hypothetical protein
MAKMDWDTPQVEQVRWEMLSRHTSRALQAIARQGKPVPIFLIIDDTVVEKTGKKMEGADCHYAHGAGGTVLGHARVTGHLVVLGQSYPISWKLYRRQGDCDEAGIPFVSKPELAEAILRDLIALPDTQVYVLTDSWYPSQEMLNACQTKGFQFISAVKSNRKFKTTKGNLQVQQWQQGLPETAFDLVTVNATGYQVWSATGHLSSRHAVRLVINRAVTQEGWRYLISTDLALSPQTILSHYLVRWEVENFYHVAKQSLSLGDYQDSTDRRYLLSRRLLRLTGFLAGSTSAS